MDTGTRKGTPWASIILNSHVISKRAKKRNSEREKRLYNISSHVREERVPDEVHLEGNDREINIRSLPQPYILFCELLLQLILDSFENTINHKLVKFYSLDYL